MKKRMTTLAFVAMAMAVGLHAQNAAQTGTKAPATVSEETDVIANPTKKQLVGIWQVFKDKSDGRMYGPLFKILDADGKFKNLALHNKQNFNFKISTTGSWELKDGALVETIDADCDNVFAGKTNAMEMTLSEGGKMMHIIWMNVTSGVRVDEYWEKVR